MKAEARIKWWKLKKKEFSEGMREDLDGREELPDDWDSTAVVLRGNCQEGV